MCMCNFFNLIFLWEKYSDLDIANLQVIDNFFGYKLHVYSDCSWLTVCVFVFISNQFLISGDSSPVHQPNGDFELSQTSLLPTSPSCIKTEATLTPVQCNVKQEKIPMQSCGVKSIQPMPVVTVPVNIQKPQIGQLTTTKPAGGIQCEMIFMLTV